MRLLADEEHLAGEPFLAKCLRCPAAGLARADDDDGVCTHGFGSLVGE